MFDTPAHLAADLRIVHMRLDLGDNIINKFLACLARQGDLFFEFFVYIRFQVF